MNFLCIFLLSSIAYCCVQAELIDDLIDVIVHNPRGQALLKRAEENEKKSIVKKAPPMNLPWKREKSQIADMASSSSSDITYNQNPNTGDNVHPGSRGGKKREAEIASLLERIMVKDGMADSTRKRQQLQENLPWAKRDETKGENAKEEKLYNRLMTDLNDLMILQKTGENTRKDESKLVT